MKVCLHKSAVETAFIRVIVIIAVDNLRERDTTYCPQVKVFVKVSPIKFMQLLSFAVVLNVIVCVFPCLVPKHL